MVRVERFGKWFLIVNSAGGFGKFTLSADSDTLYVYDVEGYKIVNDIFSYVCEVSRQMGLKQTKSHVSNDRLIKWYEYRTRHDPLMTFDLATRICTRLNHE